MKDYFAHEPKQLLHYLARRTWNKRTTLPKNLEDIKQSLINRKEQK